MLHQNKIETVFTLPSSSQLTQFCFLFSLLREANFTHQVYGDQLVIQWTAYLSNRCCQRFENFIWKFIFCLFICKCCTLFKIHHIFLWASVFFNLHFDGRVSLIVINMLHFRLCWDLLHFVILCNLLCFVIFCKSFSDFRTFSHTSQNFSELHRSSRIFSDFHGFSRSFLDFHRFCWILTYLKSSDVYIVQASISISFNPEWSSNYPQMEVGDWIYFENMGAYTVSAASTFNGFMRPRIHYVVEESHAPTLRQIYRQIKENQHISKDSSFDEAQKYMSLNSATENMLIK